MNSNICNVADLTHSIANDAGNKKYISVGVDPSVSTDYNRFASHKSSSMTIIKIDHQYKDSRT